MALIKDLINNRTRQKLKRAAKIQQKANKKQIKMLVKSLSEQKNINRFLKEE